MCEKPRNISILALFSTLVKQKALIVNPTVTQCVTSVIFAGGKRRGRPRLTEAEKVAARQRKIQMQMELASSASITAAPSEKSSAAETLLELSNTGLSH